jgi:acyl-CoA thioester hydrolase
MPARSAGSACRVATPEGYYHRPASASNFDHVHEKEIEIRWRDLDAYGHVNNAVYLTYLEEARDEWLALALGSGGDAWDYVIARVEIDFRRELTQEDDRLVARCGLGSLGTSSVRTREELVTVAGEVAAEAEAVLVARDRDTRRARPLSERERAALARA